MTSYPLPSDTQPVVVLTNQRHRIIHQVNSYFVIDKTKQKNMGKGEEVKIKKIRKPLSDPITFLYHYLYFSKTYDTASHSILLENLTAYDLDGCVN